MKIIQRIHLFLQENDIKVNKFEKVLGLSNGYLTKQLHRNGSIGTDILLKIKIHFPSLSLLWLVTGEGNMSLFEKKFNSNEFLEEQVQYYTSIQFIDKLSEKINNVKKELSELETLVNQIQGLKEFVDAKKNL